MNSDKLRAGAESDKRGRLRFPVSVAVGFFALLAASASAAIKPNDCARAAQYSEAQRGIAVRRKAASSSLAGNSLSLYVSK